MMMNSSDADQAKSATVIEIRESTKGPEAAKTAGTVIDMQPMPEKNDESAKDKKPDRCDDTTIVNNCNKEAKTNGKNHTSSNGNRSNQQQHSQQQISDFGVKKNKCAFVNRDVPVHGSTAATATFDEYFIPVNEHRKFMRGEKLYLTMDKRDKKKGFAKYACCFTTFFILSVALVLLVLSGIGIIFQSDIPNEYSVKDGASAAVSSRHFRPDVKTGGHSGIFDAVVDEDEPPKQQPPSSPTPTPTPTTSPPSSPSIATTLQPSMSTIQTYTRFEVPNSLEAILRISNLDYVPEFANKSSNEYKEFAKRFENWLRSSLFDFYTLEYSPATILLRLIDIDPQTFEAKVRVGWMYIDDKQNQTIILTRTMLESKLDEVIALERARNADPDSDSDSDRIPYVLDPNSVRVSRVQNQCELENGNCAEKCSFRFITLDFRCECYDGRAEVDGHGCQELSSTTVTEPVSSSSSSSSIATQTVETSSVTMATTVDENEEEDKDEEVAEMVAMAASSTTTESVDSTLIPFGNDALEHPNPVESNPDEMGEIIAKTETSVRDRESPTIEMLIVENDMAYATPTPPAPLTSTANPPPLLSTNDPSRASESDFLNEVNDDYDLTNRTSEQHSPSTTTTSTTPIVPSTTTTIPDYDSTSATTTTTIDDDLVEGTTMDVIATDGPL